VAAPSFRSSIRAFSVETPFWGGLSTQGGLKLPVAPFRGPPLLVPRDLNPRGPLSEGEIFPPYKGIFSPPFIVPLPNPHIPKVENAQNPLGPKKNPPPIPQPL